MACYRRGRVWWYSFCYNGDHVQESTKQRNLQAARQIEAARRTQLAKGEVGIKDLPKAERLTIGQLLERLETDYQMEGKASAQNRSLLARAKKDFGSKMADALTAEDVDAYIGQRRAKSAADATINRVTHLLRAAYRRAKLTPPDIRHLSEKDNTRTGFFSAGEFRAVLSHLPDDGLRDFVLFAYLCGWRKGSVAALRWTDVDLIEGEINLPGKYTKNDEPLKMPIEGEIKEVMKRRQSHQRIQKVVGHGDRDGEVPWKIVPRLSPHGCARPDSQRRGRERGDVHYRAQDQFHVQAIQHHGYRGRAGSFARRREVPHGAGTKDSGNHQVGSLHFSLQSALSRKRKGLLWSE